MYHHEACVAYVKQAYIGYKIEKNIEIPKREKKEYARFIRPQSCFWFPFPSSYSIDDKSPHALAQELGVRIMVKIRGEIGYVLASGYWGKGIATKAVKLVASTIIVECPHLERLEALVDVENIGSQKVSEKVGFSRDGVLRKYWILKGKPRDMVMFSLLSTDPQINYFRYD
ncbi:hypothetical protein ACH5RR_033313 [Cinchona calisaya]|uniref:N-acetyltransferase domain-containing protein n=1 Tax=Cinchona calisaya TaxID=153742 RepID=A0ABD2YLY0_9GENT